MSAISDHGGRTRRVLLVDDCPIFRIGLREILGRDPRFEVCGEASGRHEARRIAQSSHPDLAIVDIDCRAQDGLEILRELRAHHPELRILVLSMQDELLYARRLLGSGVNGYLMKWVAPETLLGALVRLSSGAIHVSDEVAAQMLRQVTYRDPSRTASVDILSNRELQVLRLIGLGATTREIASSLHLSVKTIESHRQRIKRKLGLVSGAQLVRYAVTLGQGIIEDYVPANGNALGTAPPVHSAELTG